VLAAFPLATLERPAGLGEAMRPMRPYILDDAATLEYQRLDLMSKILDPWTQGYLAGLGVGQGWQCLELGSGNGSIAEWLCAGAAPRAA
jgi:hypothetical protein